MTEMVATLAGWTPFLAGGFAGNLLIASVAMLAGTAVGCLLGLGRDAGRLARSVPTLATGLCRNVPSFVLMFYVALVLPVELEWAGSVIAVPLRAKAALALTIPVIGFASDQYLAFRQQRRKGLAGTGTIFFAAWLQYLLIVLMATATASVIGVDEIVGRANRVIATDDRPEFLIATYVYVSGWFLVSGLLISAAAAAVGRIRGTGDDAGLGRLGPQLG